MNLLTIYADGSSLQAALFHRHKKTITLKQFTSFAIEDINVKLFDMIQAAPTEIISGLDPSAVFVRDIHLKLFSERAIVSALPFQMESVLPFALDQVILLPVIKKTKQGSQISIFAADHASIHSHLALMKNFQMEPDQISCAPKALLRLAHHSSPSTSHFLFFHFGNEKSVYGAVAKGQMKIAQPFRWGLVHFLDALKKDCPEEKDLAKIDLLDLDETQAPSLFALVSQCRRDLDRMLTFLQKKHPCDTLFLTGHISHLNLKRFIKHSLGPTITFLSPLWEGEQTAVAETNAIVLGLSLDHSFCDKEALNFRQGLFAHPRAFQKKVRLLVGSVACILLLVGSLAGAQALFLVQKKGELIREFRCLSGLEKEENLTAGMDKWEKLLSEKKRSFPYKLAAPKVAEVLLWLSTHPKLLSKDPKEKIEIKSFDYALVKYPKLPAEQGPYLVKVELEFTSSSPRFAREFYDSLMKDGDIVNTKTEVSWSVNHDLYHTTFFLKNGVR